MKKHFLLLMLMAMLPLAGWAELQFKTIEVGSYTYGSALPIPVVKDGDGFILTEGTHYEVSTIVYKDAACTDAAANKVNKEDMKGDITYYLKITGKNAFEGITGSVGFICNRKPVTVTCTKVLSRAFGSTVEPTVSGDDWTVEGLVDGAPWSDTKADLTGALAYNYAGKGNKDYPGGEYDITFSGLSSDVYEISYAAKKFTITGTDISDGAVAVKEGTAFADKTYRGTPYTAADLTGLVLVYDSKELVQGTDFTIELNDAPTYKKTEDVAIVAGKTYYTKEGDVYTKVAEPAGADIDDYYEVDVPAYLNVKDNWSYDVKFKGNYSGTKAKFATFKIVQAPLSVDVDDMEVTYTGAAIKTQANIEAALGKAVKINYYGFVAADIANRDALIGDFTTKPSVSVAAAAGATNVGTYDLVIAKGATNAGSNYTIATALNTGKLTIKAKEIKLKAAPAKKGPADEDPAFALAGVAEGKLALVGDDYLDATTVTFERAKAPESEVGKSYDITPIVTNAKAYVGEGEEKKEVTGNYTFVADEEKGQLTVEQAALTITIKDQSKFYGDEDPATFAAPVEGKNYIVTGLVAGDEITSIKLKKSWTAETVGNYILDADVTITNEDHYKTFIVVPGNFEIKKAPLTITLPIKTVAAGITPAAALETLTKDGIEISGLKKGEAAADAFALSLKAGLTLEGENLKNQTDAEGYIVTLTDAIWANYAFYNAALEPGNTAAGKLIVGTGNAEALVLSTSADAADWNKIVAANGETKTVELAINNRSTREVPAGKAHPWAKETWNTMVLPFEVTVAELSAQLGYAIVNVVDPDNTTEGNVQFKLEMQKIAANTPFCVKTSAAIADGTVLTFKGADEKGVKIVAPADEYPSVDAGMGYKFVGAYKNLTIDKTTPTYNFMRGDNNKWAHIGATSANSWTVVPFDAYVELTEAAAARGVTFTFQELDGSYTAIKAIEVNTKDSESAKTGWYTIGGMKLQSAPAQKGVYIKDGKKIVVK